MIPDMFKLRIDPIVEKYFQVLKNYFLFTGYAFILCFPTYYTDFVLCVTGIQNH